MAGVIRQLSITLFLICAATTLLPADTKYSTHSSFGGAMGAVTSGEARDTTVYIKGHLMRVDSGSDTAIVDFDAAKVITLNRSLKTYTVQTFAELKEQSDKQYRALEARAQQMATARAADQTAGSETKDQHEGWGFAIAGQAQPQSTGVTRQIGKWLATQTVISASGAEFGKGMLQSGSVPQNVTVTYELWTTGEINASELRAALDSLRDLRALVLSGAVHLLGGSVPGFDFVPQSLDKSTSGFPVRVIFRMRAPKPADLSEDDSAQAQSAPAAPSNEMITVAKFETTLTDFSTADLPASDFAVPANFHLVPPPTYPPIPTLELSK